MGTLEGKYADRLRAFRERAVALRSKQRECREEERAGVDRDVAQCQADEVQYLLSAMPFIREYSSTRAVDAVPARGGLAGFVEVTHKTSKNSVLQRYLLHVEGQVDPVTLAAASAHNDDGAKRHPREAEYFCDECDEGMDYHAREALLTCVKCGACRAYTEMNASNLTYEQEIHQDVVTYFAYKRLNHFCEWLNSLQAKVVPFFCARGIWRRA